jgi:epoxyqueuosine reductase
MASTGLFYSAIAERTPRARGGGERNGDPKQIEEMCTMPDLEEKVRNYLLDQEVDTIGVVSAEEMMRAPEGFRPTDYLPSAKSVIVWTLRLIDTVIDRMPESRKEFTANNYEAEAINQEITFRTARLLQREGYETYPMSYFRREFTGLALKDMVKLFGPISMKHAAELAGLGQIGLHTLLITPQFGPRHRLGALITAAPLTNGYPLQANLCDPEACGFRCVEVCPPEAISRQGYHQFDKHRCSDFQIRALGNVRCSACMAICPKEVWNKAS